MDERRKVFIQGLRDFAEFLELNGNAPAPYNITGNVFCVTKAEFTEAARHLGHATKDANGEYFWLTKKFGPIAYEVNIARNEICKRKVVGVRDVPAHTEEIVEWECAESILEPTLTEEVRSCEAAGRENL